MPINLKDFLQMLTDAGCTWEIDANGHYRIYWNGLFVSTFAVSHGKRTKGNEVWDDYKYSFRSRLRQVQQRHQEEQAHAKDE